MSVLSEVDHAKTYAKIFVLAPAPFDITSAHTDVWETRVNAKSRDLGICLSSIRVEVCARRINCCVADIADDVNLGRCGISFVIQPHEYVFLGLLDVLSRRSSVIMSVHSVHSWYVSL